MTFYFKLDVSNFSHVMISYVSNNVVRVISRISAYLPNRDNNADNAYTTIRYR